MLSRLINEQEVDLVAVKIRLKRMGSKRKPFYRNVVADSLSPRDGRFIEAVGYYNTLTNTFYLKLNEVDILNWLKIGSQPSYNVSNLLGSKGIMQKYHEARFAKK